MKPDSSRLHNDPLLYCSLSEKLGWFLLRWLIGPCMLLDGLIITVSLGLIQSSFTLRAQSWFLDYTGYLAFRDEG